METAFFGNFGSNVPEYTASHSRRLIKLKFSLNNNKTDKNVETRNALTFIKEYSV
jgi:hypothetical protein